MYLQVLRNRLTYIGVTASVMLEHLHSTDMGITAKGLVDNPKKIYTPYDLNQPFKNIVHQLDEATKLVDVAKA